MSDMTDLTEASEPKSERPAACQKQRPEGSAAAQEPPAQELPDQEHQAPEPTAQKAPVRAAHDRTVDRQHEPP
jgi:hypothetical protein